MHRLPSNALTRYPFGSDVYFAAHFHFTVMFNSSLRRTTGLHLIICLSPALANDELTNLITPLIALAAEKLECFPCT